MKNPPLESQVVRKIISYLRSRGAYAEKVHGSALQPSMLDIQACYRGRFIALEAKRDEKSKPTTRQEYTIAQVQKAGGIAAVVYSVGQVSELLEGIDAELSSQPGQS